MRNGYGVDAFGSDPSHVVDREAERHSCAILSRQGKGGAIRDRPRISGKPVTRKAVGEGEGKMTRGGFGCWFGSGKAVKGRGNTSLFARRLASALDRAGLVLVVACVHPSPWVY